MSTEPESTGPVPAAPRVSADRIVRGNQIGTGVFVVTAVLAAVIFTTPFQWLGAVTALALFAVGVFSFLWSYFHAVNRSRTEEIGTAQLYLLTGPPTPPDVRRMMLGLLGVQVITAFATTFARLDGPDGRAGSSLAVGCLVPMLGFGLNGLWAAFHGEFPPCRRRADPAADMAADGGSVGPTMDDDGGEVPVVDDDTPIGKNDEHA